MASDARIRITEAIYGELSSKERCITVTDVLNNWLTYYDGLYLRYTMWRHAIVLIRVMQASTRDEEHSSW